MTAINEPADVPQVHIHNNNFDAGSHVWRVVATFLLIGALVSLAWALSEWGMLELAASGTAAVLSMLVQLMARYGFIVMPSTPNEDVRIEEGKSALRAIFGMLQAFLDQSSLFRLVLISIGYGVLFIMLRALVTWALGIFGNIWFALAGGCVVAAVICFPSLFAGLIRAFKRKAQS